MPSPEGAGSLAVAGVVTARLSAPLLTNKFLVGAVESSRSRTAVKFGLARLIPEISIQRTLRLFWVRVVWFLYVKRKSKSPRDPPQTICEFRSTFGETLNAE